MACKTPEKFFPVVTTPALPPGSLKGKVALITGGGTGLGKAMATTFALLGARVAIASRRLDVLQQAADEIRRTSPGAEILPVELDVRKPELVAKTVDQIQSKFGQLPNIVVNNAAGNFIMAAERLSPNAIKTIVEIVLLGTVNVTTEVGKRLISSGEKNTGCTFLSITTPYARHGAAFVMPSAISKAGVENLNRSLATEWAKHGMRFNVIAPGPVPTEGAMGRLSPMSLEESAKEAATRVPLGRCGRPEELANLAAYMCSDYASWLNGAIVDFDGGQQYFNHGSSFGGQLHDMSSDEWENIENLIRGRTGKEKSKI
uniref:2,4-dienoyl-CoA reductase n=1 Tax=Acrobeloides nanus TaxID=290746 RepID=A0A914D392_9BILA